MDKLKLHTPDLTAANIEKLAALFPGCVTEAQDEKGALTRAIDFDQLRQELSGNLVEGPRERYHLDWPGKREALLAANAPIAKTLRPCREESVNFDNTKNLFIEGDNLDALKLLQETYLGKVKLIYIDPPYNTGKDFLYNDMFATSAIDYFERSNQKDGIQGRLVANLETNGRIHSDWLSMLYPRLRLARNLLRDDGVIAISLDDHEIANTRRMCDEVFGENNFIAVVTVETDSRVRQYDAIGITHEYLLLYSKTEGVGFNVLTDDAKKFQFEDAEGGFDIYELRNRNIAFNAENRRNLYYPFWVNPENPDKDGFHKVSLEATPGWVETYPQESQGVKTVWRWSKEKVRKNLNTTILARKHTSGAFQVIKKYRGASYSYSSVWTDKDVKTDKGTLQIKALFDNKKVFDHPKPLALVRRALEVFAEDDAIVVDFFAGSGTTAHAVMALNAEDGGCRRFILVLCHP
jgi:adenine-specific DNA-methyltransferase